MESSHLERSPAQLLPKINLSIDSQRIRQGQSVVVRWQVEPAQGETLFWQINALGFPPGQEDWASIAQLGQRVEPHGEIDVSPTESTVFYLLVRSPEGLRAVRAVVEVGGEKTEPVTPEPNIWRPQQQFLSRMGSGPQPGRIAGPVRPPVRDIGSCINALVAPAEEWSAGSPSISMSISPQVIFTDESAKLTWTVANAACATFGESIWETRLEVSPTDPSGTKYNGGGYGGGGSPTCAIPNGSDGSTVAGQWFGTTGRHQIFGLTAENPTGAPVHTSVWLDVLSSPRFAGCTPSRVQEIRSAIRTIDRVLRNGAIYTDTSLDAKVDAFKHGHLDRKAFWFRLLVELQNIGLDLFQCREVPDDQWGAGRWSDYSNEVILEWSNGPAKHKPWLEYVILHELCHKVGFNGGLMQYGYTKPQLETQAHNVSGSCTPYI